LRTRDAQTALCARPLNRLTLLVFASLFMTHVLGARRMVRIESRSSRRRRSARRPKRPQRFSSRASVAATRDAKSRPRRLQGPAEIVPLTPGYD